MVSKKIQRDIQNAPSTVGVYIFYVAKTPIYIGKSVHIKARLQSHVENAKYDSKEDAIIANATRIQYIATHSEFQALVLESKLIQKWQPRYNRIWKDDKSYLYIKISVHDEYPKITLVRRERDGVSLYFGPFSSTRVAGRILREIRKVVPYCAQPRLGKKPCFYSSIGLCNPCPSFINSLKDPVQQTKLKKLYKLHIRHIARILEGKTDIVLKGLYAELNILARQQKYEEALKLRDRILHFERFVSEKTGIEKDVASVGPAADILDSIRALLQPYFPAIPSLQRIECYDISNLSQKQATAAMVVATDGMIDKSQYRKFRIKNKKLQSDFQMLTETFSRRFARSGWREPDLVVVDGGTPQVKTVLKVFLKLGKTIPVVGIAKNPDRLVVGVEGLPAGRQGLPTIKPPVRNPGFNLIRLLRDESHRFSKKYHLLIRSREFLR